MVCKYCNNKIPGKSKFCPHCGREVVNIQEDTYVPFDKAYDEFMMDSDELKEKRKNKYNEESLKELDLKVRDALEKRKRKSMTKEDQMVEDLSDLKYISCDNCGEKVVRGMEYCPYCKDKLPYADHSYDKKYKASLIRFVMIVLILICSSYFVYNNFIKKPEPPPVTVPELLPGGETVSPDYEYSGHGPMFFPVDSEGDAEIEDIEEEIEEEEIEDEDFEAEDIELHEGEGDYEIDEGDMRGPH